MKIESYKSNFQLLIEKGLDNIFYKEPFRNVDHYRNKLYYRNIIGRLSIILIGAKLYGFMNVK